MRNLNIGLFEYDMYSYSLHMHDFFYMIAQNFYSFIFIH